MLGTCDIVAFVATSDLTRARDFYESVLGLPLVATDPYASTFDAHGSALRVTQVETVTVAPYTVLGWSVPDIELAVRNLTAKGITFERFAGMDQDALGAWTAPGGDRVAWFKDPDGNTLSLTERHPGHR